jgi:hypothetical protein
VKGTITISPRVNSTVFQIPQSTQVVQTYNSTKPTIRNYTAVYTLPLSNAYIGLYTIVSFMGAEGITIGILFYLGVLAFRKRS